MTRTLNLTSTVRNTLEISEIERKSQQLELGYGTCGTEIELEVQEKYAGSEH